MFSTEFHRVGNIIICWYLITGSRGSSTLGCISSEKSSGQAGLKLIVRMSGASSVGKVASQTTGAHHPVERISGGLVFNLEFEFASHEPQIDGFLVMES